MVDNYLDLKNKGYNEYYPLRCRAISALCKPEVAQFKLDKDGKIDEWYNKKAIQPTEEEIEVKVKELELEKAKQSKKQEVINSFNNTLFKGYTCSNSIKLDATYNDIRKLKDGYDLTNTLGSETMVVRDYNNKNHELSLDEVNNMLKELGANYQTQLQKLWQLKDDIANAGSIEEVESIIWGK